MAALTGLFGSETDRRTALRHAVMLGTHGEQRTAARLLTTAPATIYLDDDRRHVGLVRDLSSTGLFVYSDFAPEPGTVLKFTLQLSREKSKTVAFVCAGRVVRIEYSANGGAVGIAVLFDPDGAPRPEDR